MPPLIDEAVQHLGATASNVVALQLCRVGVFEVGSRSSLGMVQAGEFNSYNAWQLSS